METLSQLEISQQLKHYIVDHLEEIETFQSVAFEQETLAGGLFTDVFSWLEQNRMIQRHMEWMTADMLDHFANDATELVVATYHEREGLITLDTTDGQIYGTEFLGKGTPTLTLAIHFVNESLPKFYQCGRVFEKYYAQCQENQLEKDALFCQLQKALVAIDNQLMVNNDFNNEQFWNQQCLRFYKAHIASLPIRALSREEEVFGILSQAGWYRGRQVDIGGLQEYCLANHIDLFAAAQQFIQAFNGLEIRYQLYYRGGRGTGLRVNQLYDFTGVHSDGESRRLSYLLKPTLDLSSGKSYDFSRIAIFAEEDCLAVGEFGYFHSLLAIGRSGTLYLFSEYSEEIVTFADLSQVLTWELQDALLVTDYFTMNNRQNLNRLNERQLKTLTLVWQHLFIGNPQVEALPSEGNLAEMQKAYDGLCQSHHLQDEHLQDEHLQDEQLPAYQQESSASWLLLQTVHFMLMTLFYGNSRTLVRDLQKICKSYEKHAHQRRVQ